MDGLVLLILIVGALVLLDVLAFRFGVDSRPGFGDPRQPERGISL